LLPVWVAAGSVICAGNSQASQTQRIGGGGGDNTVRMDCGVDAYMTGLSAQGGASHPLDTPLVRVLSFECTGFSAAATFATTAEARASQGYLASPSSGVARCGAREAVYTIHLFAGTYIDRIQAVSCVGEDGRPRTPVAVGAGGGGGSPYPLQCPSGEALYRVDARVGMTIDSLQGFCRPFPLRPSFDEAPVEGVLMPVSVTTPAEIRLRAHGSAAPVTISFQVPGAWASHFELASPLQVPGTIGRPSVVTRVPVATPATGAAATSVVRVLRIKGPVPVVPVSARVVPVTLTVRDGTGRSSSRSFRVQLTR